MRLPNDPPPADAAGAGRRDEAPVRTALGCGLLALAVGGCATAPAPAPTPAPSPPPVTRVVPAPLPEPLPAPPPPARDPAAEADAATRALLAFHDRLRSMSPAELALETARRAEPSGPAGVLELALLLAHPRNNGDVSRALALVEPMAAPGAPAAWQPVARLLQARLAEQRRLEELAERQAQQLREQQRRNEQLAAQLEALKAIERSLARRPSVTATPPQPPASEPARRTAP